jgi:hypothetical protein
MDLSSALSWIKLSPKYLIAITFATGIVLFSPEKFVTDLGMTEISELYKPWIGFSFLLSASLLAANVSFLIITKIRNKIVWEKNLSKHQGYLHALTPEERNILRRYIGLATKTQDLSIESGVVQGLVANKIIYRAASMGDLYSGWAYNIQPWAWEYLNQNLELLFTHQEIQEIEAG